MTKSTSKAASLVAVLLLTPILSAAPHVPAHKDVILEKLPLKASSSESREIRKLQALLKADPADATTAVALGRLYLDRARAESDPRFVSYAQGVLRPWWNEPAPPGPVQLLRAIILQSTHQFEAALRDLQKYLEKHPRDGEAWLTQATVLQVAGHLDEAKQCSMALLQSGSELAAVTCIAGIMSLKGSAAPSLKILTNAMARKTGASKKELLSALTVAAEIAGRLGQENRAREFYEEALALKMPDAYLLGSYADHLLDVGKADEVLKLLEGRTQADGLLLRLALAERAAGNSRYMEHAGWLNARFEAGRLRGDRTHLREEARFKLKLADQPDEALILALENWKVQKEPWDARLVLEAAVACGKPSQAQPIEAWIAAHGMEDVHLRIVPAIVGGPLQ